MRNTKSDFSITPHMSFVCWTLQKRKLAGSKCSSSFNLEINSNLHKKKKEKKRKTPESQKHEQNNQLSYDDNRQLNWLNTGL